MTFKEHIMYVCVCVCVCVYIYIYYLYIFIYLHVNLPEIVGTLDMTQIQNIEIYEICR